MEWGRSRLRRGAAEVLVEWAERSRKLLVCDKIHRQAETISHHSVCSPPFSICPPPRWRDTRASLLFTTTSSPGNQCSGDKFFNLFFIKNVNLILHIKPALCRRAGGASGWADYLQPVKKNVTSLGVVDWAVLDLADFISLPLQLRNPNGCLSSTLFRLPQYTSPTMLARFFLCVKCLFHFFIYFMQMNPKILTG